MGDDASIEGRAAHVRAVNDALRDPHRRLVTLVGAPGIGKTTLAKAISADAERDGHRVVWTRCWNGAGTSPLWPWHQLLDQLGTDLLGDHASDDRFVLFDSIAARLNGLDEPLLVVIDDIHWADPATLELLHFVARDARPSSMHVLATYRDVEIAAGPSRAIVADIEREAEVVRLEGLDRSAVGALLAPFEWIDDGDVAHIHETSDGNPFFALEIARHIERHPDDRTTPVSRGIRTVIDDHVAMVDTPVRELLTLAAVQGHIFDHRLIAASGHLDDNEVVDMLNDARAVGLVEPHEDLWSFDHALIGETLLAGAGVDGLARLHLATADGIDKVFGPAHRRVDQVARHLRAAGSLVPAERLLAAARDAATEARRRLCWEDESDHLATCADALRRTETPDPTQLVDVLIDRMTAEKQLRRLDQACDLGHEAAALARESNDARALARVALAYPPDSEGIEINDLSNSDQLPLREEALAALQGVEPILDAQLRAAIALSLYWETPTGDRAESHRLSEQRRLRLTDEALAIARRESDASTLGIALSAHIHANWGPRLRSRRVELAEELIDVARTLGDHDLALKGRVWRVADMLERGAFDEADREIAAFEREAEQNHSRLHLWTVARWSSNRALMDGRLDECEQLAESAMTLALDLMPAEVAFHFYTTTLGPVQYLRRTLVDSIPYLEDTAAASPEVPAWQVGLATAYAEAGQTDDARDLLRRLAVDDFEMLPRDLNFMGSMMMLALTVHHVRDAMVAEQIYDHLRPLEGRFAIHGTGYASYGTGDIGLGQAADAAGHPDRARGHFERAIAQLSETGSPYRAVAREGLANLERQRHPERAITLLSEAEAIYAETGLATRATTTAAMIAEVVASQRVVFTESATGWELICGNRSHELAGLKGFRALRELVSHPGVDLHALELAAAIEGQPAVASEVTQERIDATARASYEQRIRDIGIELQRADARGDRSRSRQLTEELDAITSELAAATGLGGRVAQITTDADRARVNVTKHVKRAIDRIATVEPHLGAQLVAATTTGMTCAYRPGDHDAKWTTIAR